MRLYLLCVFLLVTAIAATSSASFLPDNDLNLEDKILALDSTGMTEAEFNQIIDKIYNVLEPSVRLHGGTLDVKRLWNDSTVNASSEQKGTVWTVNMYGGLARRPEITHDGFSLVMCHEMGHELGGYPFHGILGRWAGAEGQADYFATQTCAKRIWADEPVENAKFRLTVNSYAKDKCDAVYKTVEEQDLCYRTAAASDSLADMLAVVAKKSRPNFNTPDSSVVSRTNYSTYPGIQCRLDTYLQGSLCTAKFDLSVIPGRRPYGYQGGESSEVEADKFSCTKHGGFKIGLRPACWYAERY